MDYENLLVSLEDGIVTVTVNRPKKLNALNDAVIAELHHVFTHLPAEATVAVVTGAEEKAFAAGADIAELIDMTAVSAKDVSAAGQAMCFAIERCPIPVIAAINGYALGAGLELALACNIRYASDNAMLGLPEVTLGIIPGYGGTQRLPRLIGEGRAMEMVASGGMINAEEACRFGLVSKVTSPDELMPAVRKLAGKIQRNGPIAVRYAMEAVNRGLSMSPEEGHLLEETLFGLINGTEDVKEGLGAFLEKRRATFHGK